MSSHMRLRSTIRPPNRYGEVSETETGSALVVDSTGPSPRSNGRSGRDHIQAHIMEFDPTLPPAAFPSLKQPRPLRVNGLHGILRQETDDLDLCQTIRHISWSQSLPDSSANASDVYDRIIHSTPLNSIENQVASNTELNPIYVKNMAGMASQPSGHESSAPEFEDSDPDEPIDASEALGKKIPNPTWKDISRPLQVEIVENMMKIGYSWGRICAELEIHKGDRDRLRYFLRVRNQQIARENKILAKMRGNQLRALMRIENSDIRRNDVPHQLVLRRYSKNATRAIQGAVGGSGNPDLFLCTAADVLAARQYLHRRALPRSFAGEWGHSLVALQPPDDESSLEPEKFEWRVDIHADSNLSKEQIIRQHHGKLPVLLTKRGSIQVTASNGTINPLDLTLLPEQRNEQPDWSMYFPDWRPQNETPRVMPERRSDGIVTLKIGSKGAARIRDSESLQNSFGLSPPSQVRPTPMTPPRTESPNLFSSPLVGPNDTPTKISRHPHPWPSHLIELVNQPLEKLDGATKAQPSLPFIPPRRPGRPIKRMLGGPWSMSAIWGIEPSIAQARYTQQIEEARVEAACLRSRVEFTQEIREAEQACMDEAQRERESPGQSMAAAVNSLPDNVFTRDMPRLPELQEVLFTDPNPKVYRRWIDDSVSLSGTDGIIEECLTEEYLNALRFRVKDSDYLNGNWPGEGYRQDEMAMVPTPTRSKAHRI
ncbi:hypothetical protein N7478_000922 [Penicillium angulare]|uniref:uncharacterized protein n=1 Tax=Penicillium angulare TaxID=116970 RepID=UPI002540AB42|nr:uncharacterized protein N7478_000922 [Penicillium angulare]KAJ5291671.1 hypothetical protein N7478_000922 [Penicillium angulare]